MAATVYMIWKARSEAHWEQKVPLINKTVQHIQFFVKNRASFLCGNKAKGVDKIWLDFL